ncbi:MAG: hypothetical protein JHC26_01500 [Thermofilum sp.]|jgi:hypothetical protein|uniref:hypothetical protein n=1 Tax=Thermofilum sp. TaxID=1961369 RepID=UPI0025884610|nr:hypothetical protein [Thermofilum sp.]MCI4407736.1 hypothetical protein [Thermofilum sp.]
MARRGKLNIYQGQASAYALAEKTYVPGEGVNLETATSIASLLLRDLSRGWTYDHEGRKIPMTEKLFTKRLFYLYPLALKHYGKEEARKVRDMVLAVFASRKIPSTYAKFVKLEGENKNKVIRELMTKRLLPMVVPQNVRGNKAKATVW